MLVCVYVCIYCAASDARFVRKRQRRAEVLALREDPRASLVSQKRLSCATIIRFKSPNICQDRLGTNIGKLDKKRRFCRDEELILDVIDVHDDTLVELSVYDSHTSRLIGVVGIPVHTIHRNPKKRWIKLQDPDGGRISLMAGVVEADQLDLDSCKYGVVEMEHSLKWKQGLSLRQRIVEVMTDTVD